MKYRTRPVEIEAVQWDGSLVNAEHICEGAKGDVRIKVDPVSEPQICLIVDTLEGRMVALPGDWIITGASGERYSCKPDIFAATYEPVVE